MHQKLKQFTYRTLELSEKENALSKLIESFLVVLILFNLVAFCLETVQSIWEDYQIYFEIFDTVSVIIFTIEYGLRVWLCTVEKKYRHPLWGRIRFILTPLALIDLLAILPFYLPLVFPNLIFLKFIRAFRFLRILKIGRHSSALKTLWQVVVVRQEELFLVLSALVILILCGSVLIYLIEHPAQPEAFSSIPMAMWWVVVTLTTVGYGDIYPITPLGKLLGGILAILGIGIFALPAGILASGFAEEIQSKRIKAKPELTKICPHCGNVIDESSRTRSNSQCN